jgi:hypothetical protein
MLICSCSTVKTATTAYYFSFASLGRKSPFSIVDIASALGRGRILFQKIANA